jgi:hypothetical protein
VDWIRVDGTLRFDPKADTALKVVALVGNVGSTIQVGSEKERIQADKTARLILGDRFERDNAQRQRDPYDLGGGRLAPADLTPCPEIRGGFFGPEVPFDPPVESAPTHRYVAAPILEQVNLARWRFDPMHVMTHNQPKGYVARVWIAGKE